LSLDLERFKNAKEKREKDLAFKNVQFTKEGIAPPTLEQEREVKTTVKQYLQWIENGEDFETLCKEFFIEEEKTWKKKSMEEHNQSEWKRDSEGKIIWENEFEIDGIKMTITGENKEIVNWESVKYEPMPLMMDEEEDEEMEEEEKTQAVSTEINCKSLKEFIDVPDPIKNVLIETLSSSWIKLSWQTPCLNNRPLKQFIIEGKKYNPITLQPEFYCFNTTPHNEIYLEDLPSNYWFCFDIKTENQEGIAWESPFVVFKALNNLNGELYSWGSNADGNLCHLDIALETSPLYDKEK